MGRMLDGQWATHDLGTDEQGRFVRRETVWRTRFSLDGSTPFPPAAGRYHLYGSWACGWNHRVLLIRALLGLQDAIPFYIADPLMGSQGWTYSEGADPLHGITHLWQLYKLADDGYTGRCTVPTLWDADSHTIVNNESIELVEDLCRHWRALSNGRDLWPTALDAQIRAMSQANYNPINNGVYRCGFARSQQAYDDAATALFERLAQLELLLGERRYLLGDQLTAADVALFPHIYRFDAVYHIHFKCSRSRIVDHPNLWAWARDVYQQPGVASTCNLPATMEHYYTSHESVHPRGYVPLAPDMDWDAPHGRG